MNTTMHVGRIGALAVAPGIRNVRRNATRVSVSIGAAALVVTAAVAAAPVSTESPAVKLSADSTALLVCGTSCPTFHDADIEIIMNQFITPTHPGQTLTPVAVTTPAEAWPLTGVLRLLGLAVGDPRLFGPGGAGWPDEPWWKLSGLFDLTGDQSIQAGVADLEAAMATHGNEQLVIYGYSQGAVVVVKEMARLAEHYPVGTDAPNISFVLGGSVGRTQRRPRCPVPGPPHPDPRVDLRRPRSNRHPIPHRRHHPPVRRLCRLPVVSAQRHRRPERGSERLLRAHWPFDVSLPPDPTTSPAYQGTYGDSDGRDGTSYYFFQNPDLPLFASAAHPGGA